MKICFKKNKNKTAKEKEKKASSDGSRTCKGSALSIVPRRLM